MYSRSVTCSRATARTLRISTATDVTAGVPTLVPHPVSFERTSAPRTVLATRTSPTVRDHEDMQPIFQFSWDSDVEMRLGGDAVRFGRNPTQEFAEAKYVGIDRKGFAFQTEHEDTRRRLWTNTFVRDQLFHHVLVRILFPREVL